MLVTVGDLVLDVLVRPAGALAPGSDVRGAVELGSGGSAANVAAWAARLRADVRFLGAVGDDPTGAYLLDDLAAEGVDASRAARIPGRSPAVCALVGPDGERTMVTDRRATLRFGAEHVPPDALAGARHLHLTAYSLFDPGPEEAAAEAARQARAAGATLSVDLSSAALLGAFGAARTRRALRELGPDVLFGNAQECAALAEVVDLSDALPTLSALAPTVVVKRGREGCLLVTAAGATAIPTVAVPPLDTTGAGDAFDAAWLCAWLGGAPPEDACRAGNALAGRVVRVPGARGALPEG